MLPSMAFSFDWKGKKNRKAAFDPISYEAKGKSVNEQYQRRPGGRELPWRQENEETLIYIGFHCLYCPCIQLIVCE